MFERFTDRARRVVSDAQEASEQLGHNHIGTEHLLLAMAGADGGVAHGVLISGGIDKDKIQTSIQMYRLQATPATSPSATRDLGEDAEALESIGIDLDAVRAKIEETFGPGALEELPPKQRKGWFGRKGSPWRRPFTPRAKKVLELSLREALALKHGYIGTEHLLLGLLREGNGLAAKILADAGFDFVELRRQVIAAIPAR